MFPLGRVLGGSSSLNAMMCVRGRPEDQEPWGPGWEWETVSRLYERSAAGPFPLAAPVDPSPLSDAFLTACATVGIARIDDVNAGVDGAALVPVSQHHGRRFSVVDGYLRTALRRPNLTVATGTGVARGSSRRPIARSASRRRRRARARDPRRVILCAGAIGSPRLLLLSGVGAADELDGLGLPCTHELPGVGRGLRDHIANGILAATVPGVRTLADAESLRNLTRWLLRRRGPLTSNVAEAAAFVRTSPALSGPGPGADLRTRPVRGRGTRHAVASRRDDRRGAACNHVPSVR